MVTVDAHGLDRQIGFVPLQVPERFMELISRRLGETV
jgi:hypothetical protein